MKTILINFQEYNSFFKFNFEFGFELLLQFKCARIALIVHDWIYRMFLHLYIKQKGIFSLFNVTTQFWWMQCMTSVGQIEYVKKSQLEST